MDSAGQKERPLIVLLGENHSMVPHRVFQLALVQRTKEREIPTSVLLEASSLDGFDSVDGFKAVAQVTSLKALRAVRHAFNMQDRFINAPLTKVVYLEAFDRLNVPVWNIDVPFSGPGMIEMRAPLVCDALFRMAHPAGDTLAERSRGPAPSAADYKRYETRLRNFYMAQHIENVAGHRGGIAFVFCGQTHITGADYGWAREQGVAVTDLPWEEGLAALLSQRGHEVQSVFSSNFSLFKDVLSREISSQVGDIHFEFGLPQVDARYAPWKKKQKPSVQISRETGWPVEALKCAEEETTYVSGLLRRLPGLEAYAMSVADIERARKQSVSRMRNELRLIGVKTGLCGVFSRVAAWVRGPELKKRRSLAPVDLAGLSTYSCSFPPEEASKPCRTTLPSPKVF